MTESSDVAYHAPESIPEAHRRLDRTDGFVKVIAGGQTLALLLRHGLVDADALVDVGGISGLAGVTVEDTTASVGSATTYAALADHELSDRIGMLGDACAVIGDRQVRNLGTVGGAVCHADPAFDIVAVLCCLDADLRLGSVAGRRTVSLEEFLVGHMRTDLGESELLEAAILDLPGERTGTAYEKHSATEVGWSTIGAAARVTVENGRITDAGVALAAVADTAVRAPSVEAELVGESATHPAFAAAGEAVVDDIDPIDDNSGSAAYKRGIAPVIVERSLQAAARRAGGDR